MIEALLLNVEVVELAEWTRAIRKESKNCRTRLYLVQWQQHRSVMVHNVSDYNAW
jgi:hypothetical protein